jgi:flavin-dependent dehydrogenase
MQSCDVLIVGGGPAGSSCASALVRAGLDVLVADKADFPRDKVCAGWITPEVVRTLNLDLDDYADGRTLQAFTGFQTGSFAGDLRLTDFGRVVSYGIRRCEFDHYLLERSGARRVTGRAVKSIRRDGPWWIADESIRARTLVGAGGHFCPVARYLNNGAGEESVVVAQEVEVPLADDARRTCQVRGETPELIFWPDLLGYAWCVRKGGHLNLGAGRLTRTQFPAAVREFVKWLERRGLTARDTPLKWKGHAYLLNRTSARRLGADGVLLVGDAAGLALAPSGEGILAAVESGLMGAEIIVESYARGCRTECGRFLSRIESRFGRRAAPAPPRAVSRWLAPAAGRVLLGSRWLTRRLLLEDWFLHMHRAEGDGSLYTIGHDSTVTPSVSRGRGQEHGRRWGRRRERSQSPRRSAGAANRQPDLPRTPADPGREVPRAAEEHVRGRHPAG